RCLWKRTERACAIRLAAANAGSIDVVRGMLRFHPLLQRGHGVEAAGTIASAAMRHSRDHEQPVGILRLGCAAQFLQRRLVVIHAVARRNLRVTPAVILDPLAAACEECPESGSSSVDALRIHLFRASDIGVEIERAKIPVRILEYHETEIVSRDTERLCASPGAPTRFAAWRETGIEPLAGARIGRRRV